MVRCPNGHENPDGARFCNACGSPLSSGATSAPPPPPGGPPPPPSTPPLAVPPRGSVPFWKRPVGIVVLVLVGLLLLGGIVTAIEGPPEERGVSPTNVPAEESTGTPSVAPSASPSPSPPPPAEDPDGTYTTSCDYLLGNFTQTQAGYRAIATAKVKNTGNIGTVLRVKAHWDMVGRPSLVAEKTVQLKVGQSRKVDFSEVLSSDELDAMQNAALDFDDWCNVKATITDTFGAVQG
jgi:hypothetical protein